MEQNNKTESNVWLGEHAVDPPHVNPDQSWNKDREKVFFFFDK